MFQERFLAAAACVAWAVAGLGTVASPARAADLKLEKGDHIDIIGNTLADKLQFNGQLETLILARNPELELTFRNLGHAGDEIDHRERSANFGAPDDWLTRTQADVVLEFFGYNESYAGPAGLDKFKDAVDKNLKEMLGQKYNGKSAPRVVLFSPIAHEDLHDPNLPEAKQIAEDNKNLKLYTDAMAEVAKADGVQFVDLFAPSLSLYASSTKPLTLDGAHLTDYGYDALAPVMFKEMFPGAPEAKLDGARLEKILQAVNQKNWYWFHRYRVLDGFNVYGGRSKEAYVQLPDKKTKLTNFVVLQREMNVLDVMTANRDKQVWAVANGNDNYKVDDSDTPPFIPVKTNVGPKLLGPNGEPDYLSGQEEIKHIKAGANLRVNLFADEKQFPDLANPVQMSWDNKGRLWVAVWPDYPHWKPKTEMNDKLLVLEDTTGSGKADKCTVFADHLNCPTGFTFYNGGVLLAQCPDLVFLKDTTGSGKADFRQTMMSGFDSADTHHMSNSFVYGPGGALYWQEGTFFHSQVETPWGPTVRSNNACVWRFEPKTFKLDVYAPYGFANPHGHVFDSWGTDIIDDGTGAVPYYGPTFTGHLDFPAKHPHAPTVYKQRTRPCAGTEILSSKQFPAEYQGNYLVANVIGFQGILRYKLEEKGAGLVGTELEPIVQSDDQNFRPSAIEIGPDGAIYFCDWQNVIIGHLQHHIRDPLRDHAHGRIYRVTYEGRPLETPPQIAGAPVEKLLDLLKDPENRVRYRAKIELGTHDSKQVLAALEKWIAGLDKNDPAYQHNLMEALWVKQWNNTVDETLLKQMLRSPDYHARAAATRVLCYWRDRIPDVLDLLKVQATDDSPRVRLEAVRACSFFQTAKAADVALESLNKDQDSYLKYSLDETMKALDKYTKEK